MSASDMLRKIADDAYRAKEIPLHVREDLRTLAIEVKEIERELDERNVVTAREHSRVVRVYIDLLSGKSTENYKLRELVREMYGVISMENSWWDGTCEDTKRFADRMRELGIETE